MSKLLHHAVPLLLLLLCLTACTADSANVPPASEGTQTTTAPTVHIHDFSPATCTDPELCVTCGQPQGSPTGHRWKEANCLAPVVCLNCGTTKDTTTPHTYRDGTCSFCGKGEFELLLGPQVWIGTNGGVRYHSDPDCSNMKSPVEVLLWIAERYGFTPCKKCW